MQRNRLFETGALVLVVGAVVSLIGGIGEIGYIQCIASSGSACTATTSTQYITVFLANSEMLSVGLSIALVGAVIMIGGSITNYLTKLSDEAKNNPLSNPALSEVWVSSRCHLEVLPELRRKLVDWIPNASGARIPQPCNTTIYPPSLPRDRRAY